ncbi:MAG: hypothetical protein KC501_25100 [Myxococcales bacterium]|nr:hypothetical protein [Myxococcales bacterium]
MASPLLLLGLGWASADRPAGHLRIARALQRWERLSPKARKALRELVIERTRPSVDVEGELVRAELVALADGRCVALYPGAGLVALDNVRAALQEHAAVVLQWYRLHSGGLSAHGGILRVRGTYHRFETERPSARSETLAVLQAHALVGRAGGRVYRSTVRGWAVARLLELESLSARARVLVLEEGGKR